MPNPAEIAASPRVFTFQSGGLWGFNVTAYLPTVGMVTLVQDRGYVSRGAALAMGKRAKREVLGLGRAVAAELENLDQLVP